MTTTAKSPSVGDLLLYTTDRPWTVGDERGVHHCVVRMRVTDVSDAAVFLTTTDVLVDEGAPPEPHRHSAPTALQILRDAMEQRVADGSLIPSHPDLQPVQRPDVCQPGAGKVTVSVRVDYSDGPLAGMGDLFLRYAPCDGETLASALCAAALLDPADREFHTLLRTAHDERAHLGMALVRVDGHLLAQESLPDLLPVLQSMEQESCSGDWRIGGGF